MICIPIVFFLLFNLCIVIYFNWMQKKQIKELKRYILKTNADKAREFFFGKVDNKNNS